MSEDSKPQPAGNGEGGKNRNRNRNRRRRNNRKPRPEGQDGQQPTAHGDGSAKQGRQEGGGRRPRKRANNNRNRQNGGNQKKGEGQGRQSGGGRRRGPKTAPKLTFFQKVLKFLGLYTPPEPPKKKPRKPRKEKLNIEGDHKPGRSEKSHAPKDKSDRPRRNRRPKRTQVEPGSVKNGRLYIGNLSYDASEHDLQDLFKGVGTVRRVEVIYNPHTHRSKGYGFITMSNADEAQRAIEVLHDQYFLGRRMVVNVAKDKSEYETPDEPLKEQSPELDADGNPPVSTAPTAAPSMAAVAAEKASKEAEALAAEQAKAEEAEKVTAEASTTPPTPAIEGSAVEIAEPTSPLTEASEAGPAESPSEPTPQTAEAISPAPVETPPEPAPQPEESAVKNDTEELSEAPQENK